MDNLIENRIADLLEPHLPALLLGCLQILVGPMTSAMYIYRYTGYRPTSLSELCLQSEPCKGWVALPPGGNVDEWEHLGDDFFLNVG